MTSYADEGFSRTRMVWEGVRGFEEVMVGREGRGDGGFLVRRFNLDSRLVPSFMALSQDILVKLGFGSEVEGFVWS